MGFEQVQNFLTVPELPDIISYIIITIIFIYSVFTKAFIKKDNKTTLICVETKTARLNKLEKDLEKREKELLEERKRWEDDRLNMKKELATIKKAIRTSCGNTHELVSNGIANHIAKMLPLEEGNKEEQEINIDEEEV